MQKQLSEGFFKKGFMRIFGGFTKEYLKISISVTNSEAVAQRFSVKKLFLEILQSSQ